MTTFTLDANGAAMAGQGLGNLFRALAVGDMVKNQSQQAQQDKLAQMYLREMQGRKYGAEAQGLEMTNAARQQPIDTSLPERLQLAYRLFNATGDTNMLNFAKASGELQSQGLVDEARANVGNVDMMNRLNTLAKPGNTYDPAAIALNAARAAKENQTIDIRNQALGSMDDPELMNRLNVLASPGKTYEPFAAVGNTGSVQNKATGEQGVVNDVLARLYADRQTSLSNSSNVLSELNSERLNVLRETGKLPGTGSSGEDATNAKMVNQLAAAIEKDLPGLRDDEFIAELRKRVSRRMQLQNMDFGSDKNPPTSSGGSTMEPKIPPGYKLIGTSNGKPVYEAPDGKRYILE